MKKYTNIFFVAFIILVSVCACRPEPKETPTKGYLKCLVDESLFNVIKEERDTFVGLYKNTKVDLSAMKAREGIAAVLNGEAKIFISSRNLNNEEKDFLDKTKPEIKIFKFCYDGVALIVNEFESLDKITIEELKNILSGGKSSIQVFMPERNSGVYEYVKSEILNDEDPKNITILKSEKEIIDKIRNSRNMIGIVGLNMISNEKNIKAMHVSIGEKNIVGDNYYEPIPGYLVNGSYPLVRTCYILINEIGVYVASGFASFLTSTEGQKIVLKNNLGPATVPVKLKQLY